MEGALLRHGSSSIYRGPFSTLYFIAIKVIKALLTSIYASEYKDWVVHDDSRVAITGLGPDSLESSNLEP